MNVRPQFPSMHAMREAVNKLEPGQYLLYHRGSLASDRRMIPLIDEIANYALVLGTPAGKKILKEEPGFKVSQLGTGFGQLFQKRVPRVVYINGVPSPLSDLADTEYYLRRKPA